MSIHAPVHPPFVEYIRSGASDAKDLEWPTERGSRDAEYSLPAKGGATTQDFPHEPPAATQRRGIQYGQLHHAASLTSIPTQLSLKDTHTMPQIRSDSSPLSSSSSMRSIGGARMSERTANGILAHVYRCGLREGWLQENDEFGGEGVFMLLDNPHDSILAFPKAAQSSADWVREVLTIVQAPCAIVTQSASIASLLALLPHHQTITLHTGEELVVVDDVRQVSMMTSTLGCLLVRENTTALSYGSAKEALRFARYLDTALGDTLLALTSEQQLAASTPYTVSEEQLQPQHLAQHQSSDAQEREWLDMLHPAKPGRRAAGSVIGDVDHTEKSNGMQAAEMVKTTDNETGETILESERTPTHMAALLTGLGVAINMVIMSLFARDIVLSTLADGNYMRTVLLVAIVPRFFVAQYFCDHLVLIIAQLLFPVSQMHRNSLFYSGIPSAPLPKQHKLPHFTIHMPCYKEGLQTVLAPTLKSVAAAVQVYQLQGGTVNVIVSEDGLRLLSKEEAEERLRFYRELGCSWVARPRDGEDGYKRLGRFKKASNLNFAYTLSLRLEEILAEITASHSGGQEGIQIGDEVEQAIYTQALERVLAESKGRAWASGNIRIGDYILLIDSDTRVPEDCLIQAAAELERSPDVGALQHCSGITYVQHHYFERLLGYFVGVFTNFSISWVCANGAMAPLMGHNVFLRWTALQEVASKTLVNDEHQILSSQHVSEDYELAMRLQMAGYCVRWATYSNQGFREGVSLNPTDEKARWQKYAFGACEILFNPLVRWYKSPFTALFWRFMWSRNVATAGKLGMLSYLFSYFALGVSLPLTVLMTVVQGLFWPTLDTSFKPIFDTWISVIFVFNIAGAVGLVTVRARAGHSTFSHSLLEGLEHLPAIVVFFSGITYHVAASILAYFFSVPMTWQATNKDFQQTTIQQVIRRFWHCYLTMTLLLVASVVAISPLVPAGWRIGTFTILFPLYLAITMHFLFPILLDPGILHKFLPRYYTAKSKAVEPSRSFFYGANTGGAGPGHFHMAFEAEKAGSPIKTPGSVYAPSSPSSHKSFATPRISRNVAPMPSPDVAHGYCSGTPGTPGASMHSIHASPSAHYPTLSYFQTQPDWQDTSRTHATPGLAW